LQVDRFVPAAFKSGRRWPPYAARSEMGGSGGAAASVAFFSGMSIGLWNLGVDSAWRAGS